MVIGEVNAPVVEKIEDEENGLSTSTQSLEVEQTNLQKAALIRAMSQKSYGPKFGISVLPPPGAVSTPNLLEVWPAICMFIFVVL